MAVCVGCGLAVDPITGILNVDLADTVSGDETSGLHCDQDSGLSLNINHAASSCGIFHSGLGTAGSPLIVTVDLASEDPCNGITCVNGQGLFAAAPRTISQMSLQTSPQNSGLPQAVAASSNYNYLNSNATDSIHICNDGCCPIAGFVQVETGNIFLDANPGFLGRSVLQLKINGGAFTSPNPETEFVYSNQTAGVVRYAHNLNATYYFDLDEDECLDIQWNLRYETQPGSTGTLDSTATPKGPHFRTNWWFNQNCTNF